MQRGKDSIGKRQVVHFAWILSIFTNTGILSQTGWGNLDLWSEGKE